MPSVDTGKHDVEVLVGLVGKRLRWTSLGTWGSVAGRRVLKAVHYVIKTLSNSRNGGGSPTCTTKRCF